MDQMKKNSKRAANEYLHDQTLASKTFWLISPFRRLLHASKNPFQLRTTSTKTRQFEYI